VSTDPEATSPRYLAAVVAYLASLGAIVVVTGGLWHSRQINIYRQTHDLSEVYESLGPDIEAAMSYLGTMILGGSLVLAGLIACCSYGVRGWKRVAAWLVWACSLLAVAFFSVHYSLGVF